MRGEGGQCGGDIAGGRRGREAAGRIELALLDGFGVSIGRSPAPAGSVESARDVEGGAGFARRARLVALYLADAARVASFAQAVPLLSQLPAAWGALRLRLRVLLLIVHMAVRVAIAVGILPQLDRMLVLVLRKLRLLVEGVLLGNGRQSMMRVDGDAALMLASATSPASGAVDAGVVRRIVGVVAAAGRGEGGHGSLRRRGSFLWCWQRSRREVGRSMG